MKRKKTGKKTKTKKAAPNAAKKEAQNAAVTQPMDVCVKHTSDGYNFLDCAIIQLSGEMEWHHKYGFLFRFSWEKHTDAIAALISSAQRAELAAERQKLNDIVLMLGRIANAIQSPTFPRIAKLRKDLISNSYPDAVDPGKEVALSLAREVEACHDLLLAEIELVDARKLAGVWASEPAYREEVKMEIFHRPKGMKPETATRKSRETAYHCHKQKMALLEMPEKIAALAKSFKALADKAERGIVPAPFDINIDPGALMDVLLTNTDINYIKYSADRQRRRGAHGGDAADVIFSSETERTKESLAKHTLGEEMIRYLKASHALAQKMASPSADGFLWLASLLESRTDNMFFGDKAKDRLALAQFVATLQVARRQLHDDAVKAKREFSNEDRKMLKELHDKNVKGKGRTDAQKAGDVRKDQVVYGLRLYKPRDFPSRKAAKEAIDHFRGRPGAYSDGEIDSLAREIQRAYKGK